MDENKKDQLAPTGMGSASRESARGIITREIDECKRHLASLEVLEKAINWDVLSDEQETLLWGYFIRSRK